MKRVITLPTRDERAVSTTVTYVLTIAITTILLSGLITAAGGLVGGQQEQATRNELGVVGERIAGELTSVDHLVQAGTNPDVRLRTSHPRRIVGAPYSVELKTGGENPCTHPQCLVLSTADVTVTVPFDNATAVSPGRVVGGDVVIEYDRTNETLVLGEP
ncbi:hypothetical protein SAMN05421858_1534 [Haladaptatus litoreus]|uniref:Uncharacterized protein n=1 Tax=Haladaptatus litoreus TaxID=553468 RepID=A0A1N6YEI0_9EURY|nr:hypothetical protein [Haladaptatus litoreus]SIR13025.1 hypothetical protein SAMN05421858_1534 [Haladaptatus litoreus]